MHFPLDTVHVWGGGAYCAEFKARKFKELRFAATKGGHMLAT